MSSLAEKRLASLDHTRARKMARSVHAYVRGNTAQFYEWLAQSPVSQTIPVGPAIWICGDCHLGNLGPLADADRRIDIQIRDLDQTTIGNPAHDLIRLGLSLETAARSSDLPGVTVAHMVEAMIDGYARALTPAGEDDPSEPNVVRAVRKEAAGRRWRNLAKERIEDVEPTIPIGKRFLKLTDEEREAIRNLFAQEDVRSSALAIARREPDDCIHVLDAAYWIKGCSSLGKLRYAVLICLSNAKGRNETLALVDIKEAVASVAPAAAGTDIPGDPAMRVVAGARALSPNLGERMIPAQVLGKPVVMRELAPQDLKIEVEQFSSKQAVAAARYLAYVVGIAHARQLSDEARLDWLARVTAGGDHSLDAPTWLWRSIVDLAARHEAGYLEHCRRYALTG